MCVCVSVCVRACNANIFATIRCPCCPLRVGVAVQHKPSKMCNFRDILMVNNMGRKRQETCRYLSIVAACKRVCVCKLRAKVAAVRAAQHAQDKQRQQQQQQPGRMRSEQRRIESRQSRTFS